MPTDRFEKYTSVFVETGSYLGDGIKAALVAGYNKVHSIEIAEPKYQICKDLFKDEPKVQVYLGDSCDLLGEVIAKIKEPITFWLDGHFSEGDRKLGTRMKHLCPLIQELDIIKQHQIKSHVILIDDTNCWNGMENFYHEGFDLKMLIEKVKEVNSDYKISYIDGKHLDGRVIHKDILIARI